MYELASEEDFRFELHFLWESTDFSLLFHPSTSAPFRFRTWKNSNARWRFNPNTHNWVRSESETILRARVDPHPQVRVSTAKLNAPIRLTRHHTLLRPSPHRTPYGLNEPMKRLAIQFNSQNHLLDFGMSRNKFEQAILSNIDSKYRRCQTGWFIKTSWHRLQREIRLWHTHQINHSQSRCYLWWEANAGPIDGSIDTYSCWSAWLFSIKWRIVFSTRGIAADGSVDTLVGQHDSSASSGDSNLSPRALREIDDAGAAASAETQHFDRPDIESGDDGSVIPPTEN